MKTIEQRFWDKVGSHTDPKACWLWLGSVSRGGGKSGHLRYGQFRVGLHIVKAHRFAYELLVGQIPKGMTIDHARSKGCTNTLCVNPAHLEIVTIRENTLRGDAPAALNSRKVCCIRGHLLNVENTYVYPDGRRACRLCSHDWHQIYAKGAKTCLS